MIYLRRWFASCLLLLVVGLGPPVIAQDRMPTIPSDKLTEEQKKAIEAFLAAQANIQKIYGDKYPRPVQMEVGLGWSELLRSPELMLTVNAMREYVEYKPALAPRIRELVIMITGRQSSTDFMWNSHYAVAIKTGISPEILKSIENASCTVTKGVHHSLGFGTLQEHDCRSAMRVPRLLKDLDASFRAVLQLFTDQCDVCFV
jgi:hypothetical protein